MAALKHSAAMDCVELVIFMQALCLKLVSTTTTIHNVSKEHASDVIVLSIGRYARTNISAGLARLNFIATTNKGGGEINGR